MTDAQAWLRQQARKVEARTGLGNSERAVAAAVEIEAWLQKHKVRYAPATGIPLAMIDEKKSRANQARKEAVVAETVERYSIAMKANEPFPPIVVYRVGQKLVIIDGNHRHAAAKKAGREYVQGIIIAEDTPSELVLRLTVEANRNNGLPSPLEWRVKQGIGLLGQGFSMEESADSAGISVAQLRAAKQAQEADTRALSMKIFGFTEIPVTSKQYLQGLKDDPVFKRASLLVVGKKLSVQETYAMVRAIKAARSEAEKLAVIEKHAEAYDVDKIVKKEKKGFGSPPQRVFSGAGIFMACDPAELVASVRTAHDRDEINRRLDEAVSQIFKIQEAMEALKDMEA